METILTDARLLLFQASAALDSEDRAGSYRLIQQAIEELSRIPVQR